MPILRELVLARMVLVDGPAMCAHPTVSPAPTLPRHGLQAWWPGETSRPGTMAATKVVAGCREGDCSPGVWGIAARYRLGKREENRVAPSYSPSNE